MYEPRFKLDRNKVPIISGAQIDMIAEQYAVAYIADIVENPRPFNIEGFLEQYLGLTLDYQYLSHCGLHLGMTVFNDTDRVTVYCPERNEADYISADSGTIIIDNLLLEPRQEHRYRFTLGHECGHWIFHRAYYGYDPYQLSLFEMNTPYVKCREVNGNDLHNCSHRRSDAEWMEWQADRFAAGILMPITSVKRLFDSTIMSSHVVEVDSAIQLVSNIYNVSEQAAYLRLRNLQIIHQSDYDEQYVQLSIF